MANITVSYAPEHYSVTLWMNDSLYSQGNIFFSEKEAIEFAMKFINEQNGKREFTMYRKERAIVEVDDE